MREVACGTLFNQPSMQKRPFNGKSIIKDGCGNKNRQVDRPAVSCSVNRIFQGARFNLNTTVVLLQSRQIWD